MLKNVFIGLTLSALIAGSVYAETATTTEAAVDVHPKLKLKLPPFTGQFDLLEQGRRLQ